MQDDSLQKFFDKALPDDDLRKMRREQFSEGAKLNDLIRALYWAQKHRPEMLEAAKITRDNSRWGAIFWNQYGDNLCEGDDISPNRIYPEGTGATVRFFEVCSSILQTYYKERRL